MWGLIASEKSEKVKKWQVITFIWRGFRTCPLAFCKFISDMFNVCSIIFQNFLTFFFWDLEIHKNQSKFFLFKSNHEWFWYSHISETAEPYFLVLCTLVVPPLPCWMPQSGASGSLPIIFKSNCQYAKCEHVHYGTQNKWKSEKVRSHNFCLGSIQNL